MGISASSKAPALSAKGRVYLHLPDDGDLPPELLVDHEPEDPAHGRPPVVELDGPLGQLGLLVERVPPEGQRSVAEVPDVLVPGPGDVLHDVRLEESAEEEDLGEPSLGDGVGSLEGGPPVGDGVEGRAVVADGAREVDAGAGDDLTEERELRDASVLDLDVPEAIEAVLVGVVEEAEGVPEPEGGLGAELGLERVQGDRGGPLGDGGEGGGGGDGGGEDDGLHGWISNDKS